MTHVSQYARVPPVTTPSPVLRKHRWSPPVAALCVLAATATTQPVARADGPPRPLRSQTPEIPLFVGWRVCADCHDRSRATTPCWLEDIPKHDQSFAALSKDKAEHIAMLSGVAEPPRQSRICLGCHATGADEGPRWQTDGFDIADGVQCEACHGPGSLHVERYCQSPQRPVPVGHGTDYRTTWIRRGDRAQCDTCHWPRASHHAVLDQGYRVPPADWLYKTPVNLIVSPDGARLYVVCEQSSSVSVIDTAARRVIDEINVGQQPSDLALSPDGRTLYVANRLGNSLSVIDTGSSKVVREVPIGGEPHGVATDATGRRLYVLAAAQNAVVVLDAESLTPIKRLDSGQGPWSMTASRDRTRLYVTNVRPNPRPFQAPPVSEITVLNSGESLVSSRLNVDGANMLQGIAAVPGSDVIVFTLMRTKNLVPVTRLAQGWTITNGLGVIQSDGRVDQVLLDEPNASFPDPMNLAVSPDGHRLLVSSGGLDAIALVSVPALLETINAATQRERVEILPDYLGSSSRFVIKRIDVGANPRGIVYAPDGRFAYVANALDDSISVIETTGYTVTASIALGGPETVTQIRRGARLFHSARITFGQQFSCRSCHPDGHVNGLTVDIEADGIGMSPVDNRTLRGILDTAPFKWEGTNPTLSRQCGPRLAVFFTRLAPYTPPQLAALVRYISTIPRPPNQNRDPAGLTWAQRRGKIVFERTHRRNGKLIPREQRCTTCHSGAYRTSRAMAGVGTTMWLDGTVDLRINDLHDAGGFGQLGVYYFHDAGLPTKSFDVPHLVNIYNSAPYLHNGSAATLEEIWTLFNLWDEHGVTSDLTRRQFNDLIQYLKAM